MKRFIAVLAIAAAFVTNSNAQDFTLFSGSTTNSLTKLVVNGTIQLSPVDHGWYGVDGFHDPSNDSFSVGLCVPCVHGPELRNWFAFDISSLSTPVTSLSLTLSTWAVKLPGVTYYAYDFRGSVPSLLSGSGGLAAFADLGSGASFGQRTYFSADANLVRTVTLNAAAIGSLNNAVLAGQSLWAFGGSTSPVPEPSSQLMAAVGACVVGAAAWRKRSRRAYRPINFNSIDPLSAPPTAPHPPAPHPPHQYQPPTQSHVV